MPLAASVNFVERLKRLARSTQHNEPPQWGHHAAEVLSQISLILTRAAEVDRNLPSMSRGRWEIPAV